MTSFYHRMKLIVPYIDLNRTIYYLTERFLKTIFLIRERIAMVILRFLLIGVTLSQEKLQCYDCSCEFISGDVL